MQHLSTLGSEPLPRRSKNQALRVSSLQQVRTFHSSNFSFLHLGGGWPGAVEFILLTFCSSWGVWQLGGHDLELWLFYLVKSRDLFTEACLFVRLLLQSNTGDQPGVMTIRLGCYFGSS